MFPHRIANAKAPILSSLSQSVAAYSSSLRNRPRTNYTFFQANPFFGVTSLKEKQPILDSLTRPFFSSSRPPSFSTPVHSPSITITTTLWYTGIQSLNPPRTPSLLTTSVRLFSTPPWFRGPSSSQSQHHQHQHQHQHHHQHQQTSQEQPQFESRQWTFTKTEYFNSDGTSREIRFLIWKLIGANILIWAIWQTAIVELAHGRVQKFQWMLDRFTCSWRGLQEGHYFGIIGSAFSHLSFKHLFANMFGLFWMGRALGSAIGKREFLKLYFSSCVFSALSYCVDSHFHPKTIDPKSKAPVSNMLGASGAVMSVTSALACMNPRHTVRLYGFIPLPIAPILGLVIASDIHDFLVNAQDDRIAHSAHISGFLWGVLYYFGRLRGRFYI